MTEDNFRENLNKLEYIVSDLEAEKDLIGSEAFQRKQRQAIVERSTMVYSIFNKTLYIEPVGRADEEGGHIGIHFHHRIDDKLTYHPFQYDEARELVEAIKQSMIDGGYDWKSYD